MADTDCAAHDARERAIDGAMRELGLDPNHQLRDFVARMLDQNRPLDDIRWSIGHRGP